MSTIPKIAKSDVCRESGTVTSWHLENQGTEKRRTIKPRAETDEHIKVHPEDGSAKGGQTATFYLNSGNMAFRILPNGVCIALKTLFKNKDYKSALTTVTDADKKREYNGMTPFDLDKSDADTPKFPRAFYFNPLTGGVANLISEIEILLDGQTVQVDRSGFLPISNTLNRLFIPSNFRREINGHPFIIFLNSLKKLV